MTEAEARARLIILTEANSEPTLSAEEIDYLLERSKVADRYGFPPSDPNWTPTWILARGAAEGWMLKASKLVGAYDIRVDGAQMDRSQMAEHCMKMAEHYRRQWTQTFVLGGSDE